MKRRSTADVIYRPALGRSVQLGMLYDCRSDTILTDQTLWPTSKIENDKTVESSVSSHFDVLRKCTDEEKANVMHVDPDTLLSCYGDLIQVQGAAQYLDKPASSGAQAEIAIHYHCTTRVEQVNKKYFSKDFISKIISENAEQDQCFEPPEEKVPKLDAVKHEACDQQHVTKNSLPRRSARGSSSCNVKKETADDCAKMSSTVDDSKAIEKTCGVSRNTDHAQQHRSATHVVSGIVYGGSAFFVFEQPHKSKTALTKVARDLESCIGRSADGAAAMRKFENVLQKAGMVQCEMYSDFHASKEQPVICSNFVCTGKDLILQVQSEDMDAVPFKLWLTPLTRFYEKAPKVEHEISSTVLKRIDVVMHRLHESNKVSLDLLNSKSSLYFAPVASDTRYFHEQCCHFLTAFRKELASLLPKIREGEVGGRRLPSMLEKYLADAGHSAMMDQFKKHEKSVAILDGCMGRIADIRSISQCELSEEISTSENSVLLCLMIQTSVDKTACGSEGARGLSDVLPQNVTNFTGFTSYLESSVTSFCDIVSANENEAKMRYVLVKVDGSDEGTTSQEHDMTSPASCSYINVYIDGQLSHENYIPPSAPGTPELVESHHDSLEITWAPSPVADNEIDFYEICYKRMLSPSEVATVIKTEGPVCTYTICNLEEATAYEVQVRACCKIQMSGFSERSKPLLTRPCSPPGKPQVKQISAASVRVRWNAPEKQSGGYPILSYTVVSKDVNSGLSTRKKLQRRRTDAEIEVEPCKIYCFSVQADCPHASSLMSEESETIVIEASDEQLMKYNVRRQARRVPSSSALPVYQIELDRVSGTETSMNHKFQFGKPVIGRSEKVIMVVGATGAGKTTLINSMVNYVLGVDFRDTYRFRLVREDQGSANQAVSQTRHITAYSLHHREGFKVPYTLTIIDTPGFGDTSGIERDKQITKELHSFFSSNGPDGIDHIDAIGFVVQAALSRLTVTQKYIFDSILSVFGKDIEENIFLLVTFADGKKPPVLAGVKEAKFVYKKYYKFNNSAIFSDHSPESDEEAEEVEGFDEMFWKMGMKSFENFFTDLDKIEAKSLQMTKTVLDERSRLELNVTQIQVDIHLGLNKLEQLKAEERVLQNHRCAIDRNKNFTYTVIEDTVVKCDIPRGRHTTTCLRCNRTCHENCIYADDADKAKCIAMANGYCIVCPNYCVWNMHKNLPYVLKIDRREVTKTSDDLKARYEVAKGNYLDAKQLIAAVNEEFEAIQLKVLTQTDDVRQTVERLQEIALKPHPLSALEYIDILIDSEKSEHRPGWWQRVNQLQEVREKAQYMHDITRSDYDPFSQYKQKVLEEQKKGKGEQAWQLAAKFLKPLNPFS